MAIRSASRFPQKAAVQGSGMSGSSGAPRAVAAMRDSDISSFLPSVIPSAQDISGSVWMSSSRVGVSAFAALGSK
jgi:hypothetical protein